MSNMDSSYPHTMFTSDQYGHDPESSDVMMLHIAPS